MDASPLIRTAEMQRVEHEFDEPIDTLLRRLYEEVGLTQPQIAEKLGVSTRSVIRWMVACGIPTRDRRALSGTVAA